jgi:Peptidase family M1 domain
MVGVFLWCSLKKKATFSVFLTTFNYFKKHSFKPMKKLLYFAWFWVGSSVAFAQNAPNPYNANTRFEQLGSTLPTPNAYRSASGAPGREYWQQRADYDIKAELDDAKQTITGTETITYHNQSPHTLNYLWLQLDQNLFKKDAIGNTTQTGSINPERGVRGKTLTDLTDNRPFGYNITAVRDQKGSPLRYTINQTMMRVELPQPLAAGASVVFGIDWSYLITEYYGRSGYEFFAKDGNNVYCIAHWFPRMAVYDDVSGWQNKQFLGQGEFTLCFGNYKVAITVPSDHVLAATGELQNASQVLSATQLKRLEQAKTATKPVVIVSQEEAEKAEKSKADGKKTWIFKADNVRDFAFATSRKFIWDAMLTDVEGKKVWAMSYYPKEGNPLWGKYSTEVVAHTLRSYSSKTFTYPYPVAISVHSIAGGGMEYPMICFNGGRPESDGTYSENTKWGMIGVIIHEVGHNFFPMIVNTDERQWSWMDEGLNSFLEYLAEQEWDRSFPPGAEPQGIVEYMKTDPSSQVPIMASSDNIMKFGPNAYTKPATGLNILRETIMGRELFDYAFKQYAQRWMFKSPTPADFFRTMEDASGVDLDWFWKGWFYGVEPVNQNLADVQWYGIAPSDVAQTKLSQKAKDEAQKQTLANIRNKTDIKETVVERNPDLKDFYNSYDKYVVSDADKKKQEAYLSSLSEDERKLAESSMNFYTITVKNKGGMPMPVIVKMQFDDGTSEIVRIPAEIWRLNDKEVKKIVPTKKKVVQWTLDPFFEIADIDTSDNSFPRQPEQPTRFQLFKAQGGKATNPMQEAQKQKAGAIQGARE